jgi:hypothetical protein
MQIWQIHNMCGNKSNQNNLYKILYECYICRKVRNVKEKQQSISFHL